MAMRFFPMLFVGFLVLASAEARANGNASAAVDPDLPRLLQVDTHLLRGGRPSSLGMADLLKRGVRLIVNLENDRAVVEAEMRVAKGLGLFEFSSPMRSLFAPTDQQIDQILAFITGHQNDLIYLHCEHGQDRTGLVIGLYRFYFNGWSAEDAYREMRALGFHPLLWNLDQYFKRRVSKGRPAALGLGNRT